MRTDLRAWPGPEIGAHNSYVYRDLLGLDDTAYQELIENGTI